MMSPQKLSSFIACIECQSPTTDLYKFLGTLELYGSGDSPQVLSKVSLGLENTLLRGATLRDTEYVFGNSIFIC